MKGNKRLENIIIGTLLESTEEMNYFGFCKSCITPEMFNDDMNRRIFGIIAEMNRNGEYDTRPATIFGKYGSSVMELLPRMIDLVTDYSFVYLKAAYNENRYLFSLVYGIEPKYTDITFEKYVESFIKRHYYEERYKTDVRTAAAAA